MTTVTIMIDDPNGVDSNLLFPSASPYTVVGVGTRGTGTSGDLDFRRIVNGVTIDQRYQVTMTGNDMAFTSGVHDVHGDMTSMKLNLVASNGTLGTQLIHVDFALDGDWLNIFDGVHVELLAALTSDVLMGRIMQRTSANLIIIGNVGDDILNGSFLDDALRGGPGRDQLNGRDGSDTASYEFSSGAVTVNLATGVHAGADAQGDHLSSIENIIGSKWNDKLTGDAGGNFIDGALGFDTIDGGAGDDFIFGRDGGGTLRGGAGNDRVDGGAQADTIYGGTGNDELRVGTGDNNVAYGEDGNDELLGDIDDDRLFGGNGNDILVGDAGNDILDGGVGIDTMTGGSGASRYYVDNVADRVSDAVFGDGDQVLTSVSHTLMAGSAIELLMIANAVGTGAINLTGNEFAQSIRGNAGANIINGKGGADTMSGFGGNDQYFVDDAGDRAIEATNGGSDRVLTSVTYTLTANSAIELLATTNQAATTAIKLTGNTLVQTIQGNNGANTIDGKAGADTMRGFGGNDIYVVDNAGDVVDESVAGSTGTDSVQSSLAFSLADVVHAKGSIENLTLTGSANIAGTGNSLANALAGNGAANALTGNAGNDSLSGNAGNDRLTGGAGKDTLTGGVGLDFFDFNTLADSGITAGTRDLIVDFSHAQGDRIDLSTIDAVAGGSNNAFTFLTTMAAPFTAIGQVRFTQAGGHTFVQMNTDTNFVDIESSIEIGKLVTLVVSDFVL